MDAAHLISRDVTNRRCGKTLATTRFATARSPHPDNRAVYRINPFQPTRTRSNDPSPRGNLPIGQTYPQALTETDGNAPTGAEHLRTNGLHTTDDCDEMAESTFADKRSGHSAMPLK
jgi:hypothetical protein